ncbi:MAG: methyltransferase domain-containing protein [Candidatus Paceibacterota bacterium]|jgi:ubiquinone/menaquinone biosynthesis C-methylase UbiE
MDLFTGTAKGYTEKRGEYPQETIELIASKLHADGSGRLLDVGCGDGRLTLPLAQYFKEVVAVDVSSEMIEEAKGLAVAKGINNITWVVKSGDDLDESLGQFDCISFAQALHWLDVEKVLTTCYKILTNKGAVLIVGGRSMWNYAPTAWEQISLAMIKKYLGPERRTVKGFYQKDPKTYREYLEEIGFKRFDEFEYHLPEVIRRADEVIELIHTMSFASKELLRNKVEDFDRELKSELLKTSPDDKFATTHSGTITLAFKN